MPAINEERLSDRDLVTGMLKQKEYHDRKKASERKIPNDFQINQRVAIQRHQDKTWSIKGIILEQVADRSYIIKTYHGSTIRKNAKFIRRVHPGVLVRKGRRYVVSWEVRHISILLREYRRLVSWTRHHG